MRAARWGMGVPPPPPALTHRYSSPAHAALLVVRNEGAEKHHTRPVLRQQLGPARGRFKVLRPPQSRRPLVARSVDSSTSVAWTLLPGGGRRRLPGCGLAVLTVLRAGLPALAAARSLASRGRLGPVVWRA